MDNLWIIYGSSMIIYWSGWWLTYPSWKIWTSVGNIILNIWRSKHVPNHQPVFISCVFISNSNIFPNYNSCFQMFEPLNKHQKTNMACFGALDGSILHKRHRFTQMVPRYLSQASCGPNILPFACAKPQKWVFEIPCETPSFLRKKRSTSTHHGKRTIKISIDLHRSPIFPWLIGPTSLSPLFHAGVAASRRGVRPSGQRPAPVAPAAAFLPEELSGAPVDLTQGYLVPKPVKKWIVYG